MRPLRYSINVTLDGCCDHQAVPADAVELLDDLHRHHAANLERADALLFGRVTFQMMEEAWRRPADAVWPGWMDARMVSFAETIDAAEKYVVSRTLREVDWNAELLRSDLGSAVRALKERPGAGLAVGGVTLPLALADLGLIDEYELVVLPVVAGRGPRLLDGLHDRLDLTLVDRTGLASGAIALRYHPRRARGG